MTDRPETSLLELVDRLETALKASAGTTSDALYQCDRLRQALSQSHAEGARFAAFTVGRLVSRADPALDEAAQQANDALRPALIAAGYRL